MAEYLRSLTQAGRGRWQPMLMGLACLAAAAGGAVRTAPPRDLPMLQCTHMPSFVRHPGSLRDHPALVLNADFRPLSYLPLSLWPWQEAIKAAVSPRF